MATAMYTISFNAMADEGMWLPSLISQRIGDMQAKGFRLTAEDIYSINQASLKDAVVLFGSGCTGELISPEGLLITNHHCGYGQIQRHSSVEHDYLRDGFWAMSREEELPNEGLEVRFLDRMEDVTDIVLKGYEEGMSEEQRDSLVKANSRELISKATAGGKGLEADVEALGKHAPQPGISVRQEDGVCPRLPGGKSGGHPRRAGAHHQYVPGHVPSPPSRGLPGPSWVISPGSTPSARARRSST